MKVNNSKKAEFSINTIKHIQNYLHLMQILKTNDREFVSCDYIAEHLNLTLSEVENDFTDLNIPNGKLAIHKTDYLIEEFQKYLLKDKNN